MLNDCQNYKIGRLEVKGKVFSITHLGDDRNSLVISYRKDGAVKRIEMICSDFAAANLECGDKIQAVGFWRFENGEIHTRNILFEKRRGNNGR